MVEEKVYKWRDASSKFVDAYVDAYIDWVRDTAKWLYPSDEVRSVPVLVSLAGREKTRVSACTWKTPAASDRSIFRRLF